MDSFLRLRDRTFSLGGASLQYERQTWLLQIEANPREFDGELWTPSLYHQGLRMPARSPAELQGLSTSWRHNSDQTYPHPELGLMYIFGHHAVYETTLSFGNFNGSNIELEWFGLCDVFWDDDYKERVPFQCRSLVRCRRARDSTERPNGRAHCRD